MKRKIAIVLALLALVLLHIPATLAWQGKTQTATNEIFSAPLGMVRLQKLDENDLPLAGASFKLFRVGEDGQPDQQVDGLFVSDNRGYVGDRDDGSLVLPVGEYYFLEEKAPENYDFDLDAQGNAIRKHSFTVQKNYCWNLEVHNHRKTADLRIEKDIPGSPALTDDSRDFYFKVTLPDREGGYDYYVYSNDGSLFSKNAMYSGQTLKLQYGQYIVIKDLPVGGMYEVEETASDGYVVSSDGHRGNITEYGATASFTNRQGLLNITKTVRDNVVGEGGPHPEMLFHFTLKLGPEEHSFTLKAGETKSFSLPIGAQYEIEELEAEFPRELLRQQRLNEDGTPMLDQYGQPVYEEREPQGNELAERYFMSKQKISGTITGSEAVDVEFVNVYDPKPIKPGDLVIEKEVSGKTEDDMDETEYEFHVSFDDGKAHEYRIYDANGRALTADYDAYEYSVWQVQAPGVTVTNPRSGQEDSGSQPESAEDMYLDGAAAAPRSTAEPLDESGIAAANESGEQPGAVTDGGEDPAPVPDGESPAEDSLEQPDAEQRPAAGQSQNISYSTYNTENTDNTLFVLPAGGGIIKLRDGQRAEFSNISHGVKYTVREEYDGGLSHDVDEVQGSIVSAFVTRLHIVNKARHELVITKQVIDPDNAGDPYAVFDFELYINDGGYEEVKSFSLAHDESIRVPLPYGSYYKVVEKDVFSRGYSQRIENGAGVMGEEDIYVTVTNTYVGPVKVEINGVKHWKFRAESNKEYPEYITVYLKDAGDNSTIALQKVYPGPDNSWSYSFTADKYKADGELMEYYVWEEPVAGFRADYSSGCYDITNVQYASIAVDPPVNKKVTGLDAGEDAQFEFLLQAEDESYPMPAGSSDGMKVIKAGAGPVEFGEIVFTGPGTYSYTVSEADGRQEGWDYDATVYTIVYTVYEENNQLKEQHTISKNGAEYVAAAQFNNHYDRSVEGETITISGEKTWDHKTNPESNRPDSIIVHLLADGRSVERKLVEPDKDGKWTYSFPDRPIYAEGSGDKIEYSVAEELDEVYAEDYAASYTGYNIHNVYEPGVNPSPSPIPTATPAPTDTPVITPTPGATDIPVATGKPGDTDIPVATSKPGRPSWPGGSWWDPKTGDTSFIGVWSLLLLVSYAAIITCIVLIIRLSRKRRKRRKKDR